MIKVENLSLKYQGAESFALRNINLRVRRGEVILLSGPGGCGKSTLINCLNGVMIHESQALVKGSVKINSEDISQIPLPQICRKVGTVFQNPEGQICSSQVETEIAFGLENQGLPEEEIKKRIDSALAFSGLENYRLQSTRSLSGGQKQRLMIACALASLPEVLLLDEPLSQLDPRGTKEVLAVIRKLAKEKNSAVILAEHRLEETIALADRMVIMADGSITQKRAGGDIIKDLSTIRRLGLNPPQLPNLFESLGLPERPLTAEQAPLIKVREFEKPNDASQKQPLIAKIKDLTFKYPKQSAPVVDKITLSLRRGDNIALMGANGAGKSTLLYLLSGELAPVSGTIFWNYKKSPVIGLAAQDPDLMLFSDTVEEEVAFAPRQAKRTKREIKEEVDRVLLQTGLKEYKDRAPFSLSRGQRLRTAVASILSLRPSILLLDEPSAGQDKKHMDKMMSAVKNRFDLTIFCSHHLETVARHANRVILMSKGKIIADGGPRKTLFNREKLNSAHIEQTSLQLYSLRLGVKALFAEEIIAMARPIL